MIEKFIGPVDPADQNNLQEAYNNQARIVFFIEESI